MDITTEALDCLLAGRMADVAVARDWELLREIARLAEEGPPVGLASSDPKLFERWRAAVTDFHLKGLEPDDAATCRRSRRAAWNPDRMTRHLDDMQPSATDKTHAAEGGAFGLPRWYRDS